MFLGLKIPKKIIQLLAVFYDPSYSDQTPGCAFSSEEILKMKACYKKFVINYVFGQVSLSLIFPLISNLTLGLPVSLHGVNEDKVIDPK